MKYNIHVKRLMLASIILAANIISGCASVERHAGEVVKKYCEESTDIDQAAIRARMDAVTTPHTVRVNCQR